MTFYKLKGIHPGSILGKELKKRSIEYSEFAALLDEPPERIASIMKGRKPLYTSLALKIEKCLSMEEGYLMILQVYYDISIEKKKNAGNSDVGTPIINTDTIKTNERSPLKFITSEKHQLYLKKLEYYFAEKKLFLKNDLNLEYVSKKLRIPRHHLSSIINTEFNMSFTHYVNLKRTQYFISCLNDKACSNLNLKELALRSGFKSRTTCFRFFVKQTGTSPSRYLLEKHPEQADKRKYSRK